MSATNNCECGQPACHTVRLPVGGEFCLYELCDSCYKFEMEQANYVCLPRLIPASQRLYCVVCGRPLPSGNRYQRVTCSRSCTISFNQHGRNVTSRALPGQQRLSAVPLEALR